MKRSREGEADRGIRRRTLECQVFLPDSLEERLTHHFPIGLDPEPPLKGERALFQQHRQAVGSRVAPLSRGFHPRGASPAMVNEIHHRGGLWNQSDVHWLFGLSLANGRGVDHQCRVDERRIDALFGARDIAKAFGQL